MRGIFTAVARFAAIALIVVSLFACGHGQLAFAPVAPGSGGLQTTAPVTNGRIEAADSVLAELEAMPAPEGVDASLWTELKGALEEALLSQPESRLSSRDSEPKESRLEDLPALAAGRDSSSYVARSASVPPTGDANRVDDLGITNDGGRPHLSWHYRNEGDYDQSGTVNIADITPLAVHFGETYDEITGQNSLAAVIDGSGNGKVDIADVTAIAVGFGVNCSAYKIQNAATALSSSWSDLLEVPQENGTGDGRLEYDVTVDAGSGEYYRVVPVDADGIEGEPSNVRRFSTAPPEILSVSPTEVVFGSEVMFSASVTGSLPIAYAWDFGEACFPGFSTESNPAVTVTNTKGDYPCSLTAQNAYGDDTFDFILTVGGNPPVVSAVDHTDARVTQQITFTATVTGDEPMTYEWEFTGGVNPLTSTDESPTLDATEDGSFSGTVTVTNDAGVDDFDFNFTILPAPELPEILDIGPTAGTAGKTIQVSASVKGSTPLTYLWDFGDAATSYDSGAAAPMVTLTNTPGFYDDCSLTLSNEFDEVTEYFTMTVSAGGGEWHTLTLDSDGTVGWWTSLAIVSGNPAISYYDVTNSNLKYVRANDASGTSWGAPVTVDDDGLVGHWTSLSVVNGHPAIGYRDWLHNSLKYVQAADADGTSWGTPVTVDSEGPVVTGYICLVVINGNPAISYRAKTDLTYVRANDANGTSWGTPVTVDSDGDAGINNSLAMVSGRPAIGYCDDTNGDLKYVRAADATGTSWGTPVTLDSVGNVGYFISLGIVSGHPAISYYDDTNGDLKYVRADDADGTSWGTPVTVDSAGDVGRHTSLAIDNGSPAISYLDWTNYNLKYVRASDTSGSSWGMPVTVDSAGNVGSYISLAIVNSQPAISYYDDTNKDLKFAYRFE